MTNKQKETTVIVGGGHAAGALLTTLLQKNYQQEVVLVGEEPHPPYQRPPLSKDYLAGEVDQASLYLKPCSVYENSGHQLRLGVRAKEIDRDNKTITLSDHGTLQYDRLVLATGSQVRRLNAPGADLKGIHYLHDIADSDALHEELVPGKRLVIVGGGYIGLEVAASAIKKGVHVTVLEAAERLMQRVTGPEISAFFYDKHRSAGVDVRLNTAVTGFEAGDQGHVAGVTLGEGSTIPADTVLVSIGIIPETALAEAAGLPCDDGIIVDEFTRTEDPAILAIGDCTQHRNLFFTNRQRLESVANAVDQARTAAATLMGEEKPYDSVPWFWSNQYDVRLQMVGLSQNHDQRVIRGSPLDKAFAVFYLRKGCVIAVDAINLPIAFMVGKALVRQHKKISPELLKDPDIELKSLVSSPQTSS
ncbi:pyridine nucleotide-disulfide oxidoreductase [Halovibrio salipaludis]|uniref:Pyridine nucleotide-disulfide oxidoreductase n=1 Tax=Halovibrio salipaludis TaxID=2032626 RepID=A0A2A2FBP4_9GAMM|nr:FAD-dependent oxidoreductase [Halovibrio salipaludis]PAU82388.1 pyridine nucleotide-disulfide oxidoreductase [Halovibrio salipaludis]